MPAYLGRIHTDSFITPAGQVVPNLSVTLAAASGTVLALFSDRAGTHPTANPATTDAYGRLPRELYCVAQDGVQLLITGPDQRLLAVDTLDVPVGTTDLPGEIMALTPSTNNPAVITSVVPITAATTAAFGTEYACTATTAFAVTLPTPTAVGSIVGVNNLPASVASVTVTPPAAWTINGSTSAFTVPPGFEYKCFWTGGTTNTNFVIE